MIFWAPAILIGSIALAWLHFVPSYFIEQSGNLITLVLSIMMLLVGFEIGIQKKALQEMKRYGFAILAPPIAIIIGTFFGAILTAVIFKKPIFQMLAASSGFGWYTLAGPMLTHLVSEELGTIAFLANLFREVSQFLLIPICTKYFGQVTMLVPGGATTMDTALPFIKKMYGPKMALAGFISGGILSLLAPLFISLFATLL